MNTIFNKKKEVNINEFINHNIFLNLNNLFYKNSK